MSQYQTNIFLVRHGQTEWNEQHRIQGNQDSVLTSLGKQQAEQAKKLLKNYNILHAFVSPLRRAKETVDIMLNDSPLQACTLNDLREISLGPWEGKTRKETALSHPDEYNSFWNRPDTFELQGAETFQQLQKRVVTGLENIFSRTRNSNSLVVSHWIAIKVALAYYQDIPLSLLPAIKNPPNGSFLQLTKQGEHVSIIER